jgi:hypothetical protein
LQEIYSELKDKGLELIAINDSDSPNTINKYVKDNKFSFVIGLGGGNSGEEKMDMARDYGVQAYPTNYVLDSNGKVVFRCVGFDPEGIRAALAKLGVK